ncbi:hypothetical protein [Acidithiobacillus sulfurivorans]|uniref:Uncharacterized protein n=1 Tax=Acidithiobacillus sulfurivorans TaxID=1958756 RepID=A0ABS5ZWM7_9PROT|nr:hypothetical protein [Acidithiobacillus sulfurivorans]MBU2759523.1 hypothetical protein [Acidithiobacillus sulfurivorans]
MKTKKTMILWDWSEAHGVHNVLAVEHPPQRKYPQQFSDGACWYDWEEQKRSTLAVIFGQMLAHGFTSPAAMVEALKQFAVVEDCGPWAQDVIDGIRAWGSYDA